MVYPPQIIEETNLGIQRFDIRDITAQVIAQHSGMNLEQVFEITARDTYFEAEDAVAAHLADRVISTL